MSLFHKKTLWFSMTRCGEIFGKGIRCVREAGHKDVHLHWHQNGKATVWKDGQGTNPN